MHRRRFIRLLLIIAGMLGLRHKKKHEDDLRDVYKLDQHDSDYWCWSKCRMRSLKPGDEFVIIEPDGTFCTMGPAHVLMATSDPVEDKSGNLGVICEPARRLSLAVDHTIPDIVYNLRDNEFCTKKKLAHGDYYLEPEKTNMDKQVWGNDVEATVKGPWL